MPVYSFSFPSSAAGRSVTVRDASGEVIETGTAGSASSANGPVVLSWTLPAGVYEAEAVDAPLAYSSRASGVLQVEETLEAVFTKTEADARYARAGGLDVTNLAGLKRWEVARGGALRTSVHITVLGDSISYGVGADNTADSVTEAVARAGSWVTLLRRRLNAVYGTPDSEGMVLFRSAFGQSGMTLTGSPTASLSVGPLASAPGGGGGYPLGSGKSIAFGVPSSLGAFTELDVWYWGSDSGVSIPGRPQIVVDGVEQVAGAAAGAGALLKATVTGLSDSTHTVSINGPATYSAYTFGATARHSTGFVVDRIAISGTDSDDIDGGLTGAGATRNIEAGVMKGHASLVIIALGANDQGNQVPIAVYEANLQAAIDSAVAGGACVLLLGGPPDATPATGISEDDYRAALESLAQSNAHVAYTDIRNVFGDADDAYDLGLFPTATTVHPSANGHGVIANAVAELLTLPTYPSN